MTITVDMLHFSVDPQKFDKGIVFKIGDVAGISVMCCEHKFTDRAHVATHQFGMDLEIGTPAVVWWHPRPMAFDTLVERMALVETNDEAVALVAEYCESNGFPHDDFMKHTTGPQIVAMSRAFGTSPAAQKI